MPAYFIWHAKFSPSVMLCFFLTIQLQNQKTNEKYLSPQGDKRQFIEEEKRPQHMTCDT